MSIQNQAKKGSVLGAILLVSGCCIGAGMLGLPILSLNAGFLPSLAMFFLVWLFMASTGLLLLEATLWFQGEIHVVSMADRLLGATGRILTWLLFIFLFYSVTIAYLSGSGHLLSDFSEDFFGYRLSHGTSSVLFSLFFGILLYLGTFAVDHVNRWLMGGLIASYLLLIFGGLPEIKTSLLTHKNWNASLFTIPILVISFGYHNLIPTLTTYLQRNIKALRMTILIGSALPLVVYILWQALILGIVPVDQTMQQAIDKGEMATEALKRAVGSSWVLDVAEYFAFFSIITSFLAVSLSVLDFLADGLKIEKKGKGKAFLCFLVLIPPLLFSLYSPNLFLSALNYAGGYGAVALFGIIPVLMIWTGRYRMQIKGEQVLPGGKLSLLLIFAMSVSIMLIQYFS